VRATTGRRQGEEYDIGNNEQQREREGEREKERVREHRRGAQIKTIRREKTRGEERGTRDEEERAAVSLVDRIGTMKV